MKREETFKMLKFVHKRRQSLAAAKLQQSKAAVQKHQSEISELKKEINMAHTNFHQRSLSLVRQSLQGSHFHSHTTMMAIEALHHKDNVTLLRYDTLCAQDELKDANNVLLERQTTASQTTRKYEKFNHLLIDECTEAAARKDNSEEDAVLEVQSNRRFYDAR